MDSDSSAGGSPEAVPNERTYRGWLREASWGEGDALWLVAGNEISDDPLAKLIEEDMDELGHYLTVRYHVADAEMSEDDLTRALIVESMGLGEATVGHAYSEITGYLWTDERIEVGGHDLIAELYDSRNKFLHLVIGFSREPSPASSEPDRAADQKQERATEEGIGE